MPSSEEESQCLVGSGGGGTASSAAAISSASTNRIMSNIRKVRYTEEINTQQPTNTTNAAKVINANTTGNDTAEHDLIDSTADAALLAQFHEDAIKQAGVGYFQVIAALYLGLSLAADTIEFFVIPYILPNTEVELCIKDKEKGWLANITLLGLAIGGLFWGGLGDRIGRQRSLISAMSVHTLFSGVATFMPTYGTFMTARFCSAVGIGGSMPLAYTYMAECCPKVSRGAWTGLIVAAGGLGGLLAAFLAWAIVPTTGEMVVLENTEHFSAWHKFLLLCCLPALGATIGLVFLPESPRYLIEAGRDVEAMMVYQRIHKKNNVQKEITGTQYRLSELELPSKRPRGQPPPSVNHTNVVGNIIHCIKLFWKSFFEIFSSPHLQVTLILLFIWSLASFSFYGIMMWCPEYLKYLKSIDYQTHTQYFIGEEYNNQVFNGSLENRKYKNSTFSNCKFTKMILSHVDFENCIFQSVKFSSIKSSKTHFIDSIIVDCKFIDTDLSTDVFIGGQRYNNTSLSVGGPCPTLDLDYNIYVEEVLHSHLVAQLAFVPAAILAGIILTIFQRPKVIGISLFLSSIVALSLIFLGTNTLAILGFQGGYIGIFAVAWTSLVLVSIESFPTHLRCTGFGVIVAVIRLSGIVGIMTYEMLVGMPLIVPSFVTALILIVASITTLNLPHTHSIFL